MNDTAGNTFGDGTTINGPVAGRDVHHHVHETREPEQTYSRKRVRRLPITERGLNLAVGLLTVAMFITGYQSVEQVWGSRPWAQTEGHIMTQPLTWWFVALFSASIAWVIALTAARLVRRRNQAYSRFSILPGLAGVTDEGGRGRLVLVENGGRCIHPGCNGRLRFYAKPSLVQDHYDPQTGRTRTSQRAASSLRVHPQPPSLRLDRRDRHE